MLQWDLEGRVAIAQLDDGKANAVGHAFVDSVHKALDRAEKEAAAVVLTGRPGVFSAGFDLKEMAKGPAEASALVARGAKMLVRVFAHPQPVVAACTGHAMAAGALLLLASDTRVGATGDFKIGLNETAIDMALPVFGLELAKARVSPRYLTAAVTQAQIFSADDAVKVGYLDETVAEEQVIARSTAVAAQLAELPAKAYAANKLGLRNETVGVIEESLS